MSIYDLTAYEVLQQEDLSDLKSKGTLLKRIERISGERSFCRAGKGIFEYISERNDVS